MSDDAPKQQQQQQQYQSQTSLQPSVQILFEKSKQTEVIYQHALKNLQTKSARKEILMQTLMIIGCGTIGLWDVLKQPKNELQSQLGLQKPLFVCLICFVCFLESLVIAWMAWRFRIETTSSASSNQNIYQMKYFILLFLGFYTLTSQLMLFEITVINNKTEKSFNILNPVIICVMILQLQTQSKIMTIIFHTGISGCFVSISLLYILTRILISESIGIGEYLLSCLVIGIICVSQIISEKQIIEHSTFGGRFMKNLLQTLNSIKDFYSTLLHHIPQGIAILDSSLNIHCTNTALHSILHSQNNTTIFNALNQLSWNNSAVPGTSTNINNNSSTNISYNSSNPQPNFNQILQKTFKRNNSEYKKKLNHRVSIPNNGNVSLPIKNKDQQQTMQLIESADEEIPYEIEANSAEGKQLRIKLVHYEINCQDRVIVSEDGLQAEQEGKSTDKLPTKNQNKDTSIVQLKNCCYLRQKRKSSSCNNSQFSCESLLFLIIEDQSQAQMVKKLENQNEYKMRMLASVSHELRTPLNCSISMLQIMRESLQLLGEVNMVKENLDPALYSSKLLLNLINDILDFAQLEAGKFKMTSQLFSLKQILQECLVLISIQSRIKRLQLRLQMANSEQEDYNSSSQIEIALNNNNTNTNHNSLSFSTPNDRCLINSDPNRVRQVVLNLLSNALKFTNKGRISLRTEIIEAKPLSVKIICEDTGIGIPPDRCTSIFDNFNKADLQNRIKYNQCGAGLGLSISNQLAKMLCPNAYRDQPITVVSEVGKGSSFSFVIQDQTQNIEEMTQKNNTYYKSQTLNMNTQQGKETIQVKLLEDSSSSSNQQEEEEDKQIEDSQILQKHNPPLSSSIVSYLNNPRVPKMSHFGKQSALSPVEKRNNYSEDQDLSSPPSQHNNNNTSFSARCKENQENYNNNNLDNSEIEIISKSVRSQHQLLLDESAGNPSAELSIRYPEREHTATSIQDNDKFPIPTIPRIHQSFLRAGISTFNSSFIADSPLSAQVQRPQNFDVARLEMQDKKRDEDIEQQSSVILKNEGSLTPSKKLDMDIEIKKSSEDGGLEQDDASMMNVNFAGEQLKYRGGFSNARIPSSAKLPSNGQGNPSQYTPSLYKELLSKQNSIDSHQNYMYSYSLNSQKHTQYSVPSQLNPVQLQQQQLLQQQQQQQITQQAQQQFLQPFNQADEDNNLNDSADSNKYNKFIQQSKTVSVIPSKHKWFCHSLEEFKASQLKRTCNHSQVLVVDDNQFNIIALQQQIMKFHLQVDMAFSGESALQMIKDRVLANYQCCPTYLVVFMDIDMPIMNGYEATILINKFFREQNISSFDCPIIACSAYVSPEDKQAAFDSGMLDYIVKPIMLGTLDKVFYHWFVQTHNATVSEFA